MRGNFTSFSKKIKKIKKNEKKLKKGLDFLQKEGIMFDVGTGSCRKTKQES